MPTLKCRLKLRVRDTSEVCVLFVKVKIVKETEHSYSQKRLRKSFEYLILYR
jgi:hypothetical protein